MPKIIQKTLLAPKIYELVVKHPQIAVKAKPGHFVIVMVDEDGERIPLTIADSDARAGTLTLVVMEVGTSTRKLVTRGEGDELLAVIGPLGHPSELADFGTVVMTAGGVGTAPIYPITKALKEIGNTVISIQGARTSELLFWEDKLAAVSDEHIVVTDDGSKGRKGVVTLPLKEILQARGAEIGCVYTIGPAIMMKFCAETCRPFGVKTVASLNTVMVDGTGMCGGCRVSVGGETKFTCVDGPEFDALAVDWDSVLSRQRIYTAEEKCSLDMYVEKENLTAGY